MVPFRVDKYTGSYAIREDFHFDIEDRYRAPAGLLLSVPSFLFQKLGAEKP